MGKVFLFVIITTIGLFALLLLANPSAQNQPIIPVPSLPPTVPPPTPTTPMVTPTVALAPVPVLSSSSAELFISDIATRSAVIKTTKGTIELSFYPKEAPNTVYNFVKKTTEGFYNNLAFHRVEDWVVQGGDPLGNGTGGGNIPVEFNNKRFTIGSLGAASRGDGKVQNDAQFFITKQEASWLNGKYTNFGIVTKGMDVVQKLEIGDKILGIIIE